MKKRVYFGLLVIFLFIAGCAAVDDCVCPAVYEPVCGMDGETYSNECYAECAGVEVDYEGECGEDDEEVNLNLMAMDGGTTNPEPGLYSYEEGEEIVVEAVPLQGYQFNGWEKEGSATVCDSQNKECRFIITENSVLSAHFEEDICVCPAVYEPVCGVDGETYSNECYAECAGVEVDYEGECREEEDCVCPTVYEPVCGMDGETYSNECYAECAGVEVDYEGECGEEEDCVCPAVYDPVCGVDGETYSNECYAECAGVEVDYEGECREEEDTQVIVVE